MTKITKKEIRKTVSVSLTHIASDLNVSPSRKTNMLITKVSKKISAELKGQLKKQHKKTLKEAKALDVNTPKTKKSKVQPLSA